VKFAYAAYEVQLSGASEKLVYRPVIPVTFIGSTRTQPFWALLDTSASASFRVSWNMKSAGNRALFRRTC
jgi:hypothetical protein